MKPGTKASVGRKTVTAGKSKSLPRGRATSEESRDTCQVCSVADDSASSVRVECRGGHEFTVHSKCWEAHKRMYFKTLHRSHRDYALRQRYPRCCVVGACSSDIMKETELEPQGKGNVDADAGVKTEAATTDADATNNAHALQRLHEAFPHFSLNMCRQIFEVTGGDPEAARKRLESMTQVESAPPPPRKPSPSKPETGAPKGATEDAPVPEDAPAPRDAADAPVELPTEKLRASSWSAGPPAAVAASAPQPDATSPANARAPPASKPTEPPPEDWTHISANAAHRAGLQKMGVTSLRSLLVESAAGAEHLPREHSGAPEGSVLKSEIFAFCHLVEPHGCVRVDLEAAVEAGVIFCGGSRGCEWARARAAPTPASEAESPALASPPQPLSNAARFPPLGPQQQQPAPTPAPSVPLTSVHVTQQRPPAPPPAAVGSISGQEVPPVASERIDEEVDAFISTRLLLTPQQQESLRAVLVREEVWDMWAMRHMTEQDWADVGLTIGLRKRIRGRLALG